MSPLVSVVMATFNGEEYIREAIESILKQTFKGFELIIVDDGSTDDTAKIINQFQDKRIVYVKKECNSGIADSLNLGISVAKGNYIARMDDDDVCMLNRFEEQLKVFEKNKDIILCTTNVKLTSSKKENIKEENHQEILIKMLFNNSIVHPTVMVKKDVLLKYRYNSKKVPSEDYDLWSRLIWEGKFYKIKEQLLLYRYRKLSETSKRRKEQLLLNVDISKFMINKLGIKDLQNNEENIRIFASHDYSISGSQLKGLIQWFDDLKEFNANSRIFSIKKFNTITNANLERFLISFFMNQKKVKKITPFLNLNFHYKKRVIKHYFNKYF